MKFSHALMEINMALKSNEVYEPKDKKEKKKIKKQIRNKEDILMGQEKEWMGIK